ncbi:NADPH-dependent F420 reductase [Aureivirga sp. CE67]|uniref:NADPH-dependent F420 reductase n=1 Tax=Aureivirga sp. CE67 TaxID=1788983 RepID=UPI0018C904E2|nr:NAD(P)-binding domain-containing protein [Aureivirga sp. CE67]
MKISFLGAGNVAQNLGGLFTKAGYNVKLSKPNPEGNQVSIEEACAFGEVIFITTPYAAVNDILTKNKEQLKGKIIVDVTNAINLEDWSPIFLGEESAAEHASKLIPESKFVKAFNTVFADMMNEEDMNYNGEKLTTFIASDSEEAANIIKEIADKSGFSGVVLQGLKNARYLESLAHLNISLALSGKGTKAGFLYFNK